MDVLWVIHYLYVIRPLEAERTACQYLIIWFMTVIFLMEVGVKVAKMLEYKRP